MNHLDPIHAVYLACWLIACVAALVALLLRRRSALLLRRRWLSFLAPAWKLATFAVALLAFIVVAPRSGDPTWDAWDGSMMSVLTFWSAPWSIAMFWRVIRGKAAWPAMLGVAVAWCFSASWVYDGYLLLRDGNYPPSWASNLVLSSVLYVAAGLLWNFDDRPGHGLTLAFLHSDWPTAHCRTVSLGLLAVASLPILLVSALILAFFLQIY